MEGGAQILTVKLSTLVTIVSTFKSFTVSFEKNNLTVEVLENPLFCHYQVPIE